MTPDQAAPERRIHMRRAPGRRVLDPGAYERRGAHPGVQAGTDGSAGAGAGPKGLLLEALMALRAGDFSVRLRYDWTGIDGKIADAVNDIGATHGKLAAAVERVSGAVGTEGRLAQRMVFDKLEGAWGDEVNAINAMIDNLVQPVREVGRVIGAVARGVLTENMLLEIGGRPLRGEFLKNANTINTMLDQLNSFSSEVTRVAREVGTEGRLGGQAQVKGASGVWRDLTDNVNLMASNLTGQVRNIAEVTTAVARGDLSRKITADAKGEVLELKNTINIMVDQLNSFAGEVTRVAREVGTEGKLGGQAQVKDVSGVWKDLTDSVNAMAGNLTVQLRDVSKVATAIASGDLARKITVEVQGEVAGLKDNVNQMIRKLRETTERNTEQDWLKTDLARLNRMLQGQRDIMTVSRMLLSALAPLVGAQHAVLYLMQVPRQDKAAPGAAPCLTLMASYGYQERKNLSKDWHIGEGLVGQAAFEKQRLLIGNLPDDYIQIVSGLGQARPRNIVVLPILFEGQVKAVIELAAFDAFQAIHLNFLDLLSDGLGIVFNSIETASGTEMQRTAWRGQFRHQARRSRHAGASVRRPEHAAGAADPRAAAGDKRSRQARRDHPRALRARPGIRRGVQRSRSAGRLAAAPVPGDRDRIRPSR
jgi:HAMP domain-containing protein